jgi:biopolymer transport protein ExbB
MTLLQIITGTGAAQDSVANTVANTAAQISTPTTAAPPVMDSLSLLDLVMKGGWIMVPIFILSFLAVFIFIERLVVIVKARREDNNFMQKIKEYIFEMKVDQAKNLCQATNSPVSRMIEKGIDRIGKPIPEIERSMESVGKFEVSKLEKNLKILGIVASIAPMLGFIGTIMGVIKIFYNISLADNISIGLISGGLYEKMITSASGLIVGVLAYVGYHYLNILLDKVIFKMEDHAIEFIDILQKEA